MKNADMPAFPITDETGLPFNSLPKDLCTTGMTKREMFALRAPATPNWFIAKWTEANGGNLDLVDSASFAGEACLETRLTITQAGKEAMYFAWRTYYADSLLAELEKGAAS